MQETNTSGYTIVPEVFAIAHPTFHRLYTLKICEYNMCMLYHVILMLSIIDDIGVIWFDTVKPCVYCDSP